MEPRDQEFQEQAQEVQKEFLVKDQKENHSERVVHSAATDLADRSVRTASGQEETSVRIQREDLSVRAVHSAATDLADRSVRTASVQEETSVRIQREDLSVVTDHADHSARTMTVQEEASETTLREEAADSEAQARRVSLEENSTISVMRTRAESTR